MKSKLLCPARWSLWLAFWSFFLTPGGTNEFGELLAAENWRRHSWGSRRHQLRDNWYRPRGPRKIDIVFDASIPPATEFVNEMRRVQRRPHFPCVHSIFHRNGRTLLGILFQCHYQFFCDSSGMVFGFDSDLQSNLISILLFLPFPLLWASLSWIWSGTWKFCWHFQRFSAVRFDWHPSFEAIFDDSWRLWGCLRISMRFCRDPNPQLRIFSVMIQEFLLIPSHSAGYLKFNWNYHAVWNLSDSMAFDWRHVFSLIILDQSFRNFMVNFEPCFFFSIFFLWLSFSDSWSYMNIQRADYLI